MPTPTKRTRADADGSVASSSSTPSSSSSTTTTPSPPTPSTPTTRLTAARRQVLTRSASTTSHLSTIATRRTTALTATTSLPHLSSSGGRGNSASSSSAAAGGRVGLAMGGRATSTSGSGSGAGSGTSMLLRTQSTPSVSTASLAGLKAAASAAAGGSGAGGKPPHGEETGGGLGARRFGKGKENIPPKKDEENEEAPRKRMRVTSRGSFSAGSQSGRKRSGSVASVRSETTSSGRHASLAPSSSASSIASWAAGRFASPSPSLTSSAPSDYFSFPIDAHDPSSSGADTPKQRITRSTGLPTPPPSSPSIMAADADEPAPAPAHAPRAKAKEVSAYKHLKSFLRLSNATGSSVDELIVGRLEEKASLRAYLADTQTMGQDVGMYVSGPPGTGKTALVTALGGEMGVDGWKVVVLGCMGLKIGDVWKRIGDELGCGKAERDVHEFLGREDSKVLVILDELIAISNTLDLTVRAGLVLPNGLQPQVLPFKAYSAAEMTAIVNARVAAAAVDCADGVKVDPPAMNLLGKKVEAQNGDLRMCLGVLGSAVSIAEGEYTKRLAAAPSAPTSPTTPITYTKVGLSHIMKALTSYTQTLRAAAGSITTGTASPTAKKIRSVQLQGKMVLVAMLVYALRVRAGLNGCPSAGGSPAAGPAAQAGQGDLPTSALYTAYAAILGHSDAPFPPAPESDFRDLLSNLETLGLVRLNTPAAGARAGASGGKAGKVGLCVREEEVREGLGLGQGLGEGKKGGLAEEEVRGVWEREEGRVRRVKEKAKRAEEGKEDF
ncbi:hypothetical protein IAT38_005278 [Cryptococcus sp. DSM 104549]